MKIAEIVDFLRKSPISPISRAQNRGFSAIGDLSPGQILHRHGGVQNRGFGEKSPEMLTLGLDLALVHDSILPSKHICGCAVTSYCSSLDCLAINTKIFAKLMPNV